MAISFVCVDPTGFVFGSQPSRMTKTFEVSLADIAVHYKVKFGLFTLSLELPRCL